MADTDGAADVAAEGAARGVGAGLKGVSAGTKWFSKAISAIAVVKLVLHALKIPTSKWLAGVIGAYTSLLHPIVDGTFGLLPGLFGYELLPATKDGIVIYCLFGGPAFRVWRQVLAGQSYRTLRALWLAAIWPISSVHAIFMICVQYFLLPADEDEGFLLISWLTGSYVGELVSVVAIVVAAVIFNAAGIL